MCILLWAWRSAARHCQIFNATPSGPNRHIGNPARTASENSRIPEGIGKPCGHF